MKTKLDSAFIAAVRTPICRTADYIAADLEQCCAEAGERLDNAGLIESCIDADRLWFGMNPKVQAEGKAASDLIGKAIEAHGYPKVLKYLAKHIRLI
jgi:hypothetical protein